MTLTPPVLDPSKFDNCQFDDDVWRLHRAARSDPSNRTIDWTDMRAASPTLTHELKVAFAILANSKAEGGRNKSARTLTKRLYPLRELVRWMAQHGLQSLASLDNESVLEYLEQQRQLDPPTRRTETTPGQDGTRASARPTEVKSYSWYAENVSLLKYLREAALAMARCGFPSVKYTVAFPSRSQLMQRSGDAGFRPIPRNAWIAIMHSAYDFVHRSMPDIARLDDTIEAAQQPTGTQGGAGEYARRRAAGIALRAAAFRFSDDNPLAGEWQQHYDSLVANYGKHVSDKMEAVKTASQYLDLSTFVGHLHQLALGATAISILGMTGMRVSEFLGLQVFTIDDEGNAQHPTDGPYCVVVHLNKRDVNYEFIVLRGRVFKHQNQATGLEADWVAGYRLRGGTYDSLAAHATTRNVQVDEYQSLAALAATRYAQVSKPYREKLMARDLYAASHLAVTATRNGTATWAGSKPINMAMRAFVRELVSEFAADFEVDDLDADSIHAHRFRSALANMLFSENQDLLEDIRAQLKHYHHSMTERAYLQHDQDALGITREATTRVYTDTLAGYMDGFEAIGGGPAKLFRTAAEQVAQGDPEVPIRERIEAFVRNLNRTAVTQRDHGLCDFNALNAKCLSGIPDLNRIAIPLPDENFAEEHTCLRCPNLLILERNVRHLETRLAHLEESATIAEKLGDHGQAEIHRIHAASIQRQLNALTRRTETINDAALQELEASFQN